MNLQMQWQRIVGILAVLATAALFVAIILWFIHISKVDDCLDDGGAWNRASNTCVFDYQPALQK
ncbi:MAG: hypothetical protein QM769_14570 [Pseudoxanthomonas sp.]